MSWQRAAGAGVLLGAWLAGAAAATPAGGDAQRGEALYVRCAACHALAYDRVGPHHCGLLGRRAGSVAGFDYSAAMRRSGLVWDEATLIHFLENPLALVPGSAMTYAGMPDLSERRDLVAYLKAANAGPACRGLTSAPEKFQKY